MKRHELGEAVIVFTNSAGGELCRLSTEYTGETNMEDKKAVAQILQAVDSHPLLVSMLTRLTEKVERAGMVNLSKEDFKELADLAQETREVLTLTSAKRYFVNMRSSTTGGTDTTTIEVYPGQDANEVAERIASGYDAKVESIKPAV
jgi:hypothetical protein